jgi:hypothetical protein
MTLGTTPLAAKNAKKGSGTFSKGENKSAAGTCYINCGYGFEAAVPSDSVGECACQASDYCGGGQWAVDLDNGNWAYCQT